MIFNPQDPLMQTLEYIDGNTREEWRMVVTKTLESFLSNLPAEKLNKIKQKVFAMNGRLKHVHSNLGIINLY